MTTKITNFLSQNPNWVNIVKAARCRGFLHCFGDSSMNFVPVFPYEHGNDIEADCIQSILEKEFDVRLRGDSNYDWCCEIVDDLHQLKAAKNALIILEEPTEDGYRYQHEVVSLSAAVAA